MSHQAQKKIDKDSPLFRLRQIEKDTKSLTASLGEVRQVLAANKPILDAVVEILGVQNVLDMVHTQQVRYVRAQNESRTAAMAKLIAAGTFVRAETATQDSVLLTEEAGADGTILEPGRTYDSVGSFPPEFAAQLMGMKEGGSIDTGDGKKLTVVEIYDFSHVVTPMTVPPVPTEPEESAETEESAEFVEGN